MVTKKRKRSLLLEELPADTIYIIFSYLPPETLLLLIEPTSRYLKSLLLHKPLWQSLQLSCVDKFRPSFFKKYGTYVSSLTLSFFYSPENVNYLYMLKNITYLNLTKVIYLRLNYLEDFLSKAPPSLKHLHLPHRSGNSDCYSNSIFLSLSQLQLKTLSIPYTQCSYEHDYNLFMGYLTTNVLKGYLETIKFYNFPNLDIDFLCSFAAKFKKIKHINLDLCQLSTSNVNAFLNKVTPHLESFSAKFIEFDERTMELLLSKSIRNLNMCHLNHSNREYNYFSRFKHIEEIHIVSGLTFNFECLTKCTKLKTVTVLRTRVENSGAFENYIKDNQQIEFTVQRYNLSKEIRNNLPNNVCLL
tara:strand:- start:5713 stop:6786 length:1074 start_codon:yes stop_codon:yes gene_type:complete